MPANRKAKKGENILLDTHDLPKLKHEAIKNLTRFITRAEHESVFKHPTTTTATTSIGLGSFTSESYRTHQQAIQNNGKEKILPNAVCKAN